MLPQRELLNECVGCSGGPQGGENTNSSLPTVTEGPVFAICMAGAHDQATLAKWIQGLQETNPILAQIPVVFRLARSTGELTTSRMEGQSPPHVPPKGQEEDEALQAQQQQGQS